MSKPATYVFRAIIVAALALEVVACEVYADSADGQAVLVNVAIVVYAVLAIIVLRLTDAVVRHLRR